MVYQRYRKVSAKETVDKSINKQFTSSREFKFQVNDGARKGGYAFGKIKEEIIQKIKTTFELSSMLVNSLRAGIKKGQ